VIARSRGCVPWIVRGQCGAVVPPDDDYVTAACKQIRHWLARPDEHRQAREEARRRSAELDVEAAQRFPEFINNVLALAPK
jgi:hypothetical protein